jgi:nicotinamide-nucleotide amidase
VGDRRKDMVGAIRTALGRVDILILMGGLGPTEDDLTREAVAEALSLTLRRDARRWPRCMPAPPPGASPCRRTI